MNEWTSLEDMVSKFTESMQTIQQSILILIEQEKKKLERLKDTLDSYGEDAKKKELEEWEKANQLGNR